MLSKPEGSPTLLDTGCGEGTGRGVRAMLFHSCCKPLLCSLSAACSWIGCSAQLSLPVLPVLPASPSPALSLACTTTLLCKLPCLVVAGESDVLKGWMTLGVLSGWLACRLEAWVSVLAE